MGSTADIQYQLLHLSHLLLAPHPPVEIDFNLSNIKPKARKMRNENGSSPRCLWEKRAPIRAVLCAHSSQLKDSRKDTLSGTLLLLIGNTGMIASNHSQSLRLITYLQLY